MNRKKSIVSLSLAARIAIAGAACGLAVLLAPGFAPQAEKPPAAASRVAMQEAPAALRSYAYYPEQLAALQSLGQFQPIADAGQKAAPQAVTLAVAVRPAAGESKRRAEPAAKLVAVTTVPTPLAPAPPPAPENKVKIFGLPLPGAPNLPGAAELGGHVADLGGKIANFWR